MAFGKKWLITVDIYIIVLFWREGIQSFKTFKFPPNKNCHLRNGLSLFFSLY